MATTTNPLLAIQTPQLIGIACGCAVFVGTIITVAVLFVKGGSIDRLRAEANGDKPAPPRPKLVDELLEAAKRLKTKPELGTSTAVARTKKGEAPRRIIVRRADEDDGPTTERLDVVDASLEPPKKVGRLELVDHRPRDLAIRIDNLSSELAPLALFATVDALVQRGYRRIAWRVLEPKDAALAEATGFSLESVLRKYCIEDGCSRDARLYSMLNTEWREKRPAIAARLDIVDAQLDAAWTLKDCCAPAARKKNT
jgi:hypothetical protein